MENPGNKTVIIDYGMGNLFNLQRAIEHIGEKAIISHDPDVIEMAERLILPGVGAFGDGIKNLTERNLTKPIKFAVNNNQPLLGICLGMQLLMHESEEFGHHKGLGLIAGSVKRLPHQETYKIPHYGWNTLRPPKHRAKITGVSSWENSILSHIKENDFVYFVHSYAVIPNDSNDILAETNYGNTWFCSALHHKNIFGCQFHPEISGETVGLQILKKFCTLPIT